MLPNVGQTFLSPLSQCLLVSCCCICFAGGGVASYIPGTEANRISRAEHGQDSNTYSSGNTGNNTGGGVMSYIPGTEANRVSRAENGQDPNTYRSGSTNTGEACCPGALLG